ncbi:MAG: DNA polymerase III subunit delta' [Proteobacteria bacterium]|nr:DNA polymerase III subunit delta' [Pseudomonadota bacterium]
MNFHSLFGHKKQIEILMRAIAGDKTPHAYLFIGSEGIGKKLVALKVAQALQCTSTEKKPCGLCSGCRKIEAGKHPDVILLEPDGKYIKIEQVRDLQKKLGFKPFEGNKTVCIIDGVDKMNIAAANSLLKTLEEPPLATHLILLAENLRLVIPTIISRCQKLKFNPLTTPEIEKILVREKNLSPQEAHSAALVADGSPGKAITFTEIFPQEERDALICSFTKINDMNGAFSLAEELTKKGKVEKLMECLEVLKFFLRDIITIKLNMKREAVIHNNHMPSIEKMAGELTLEDLLLMVKTITKTESAIAMNSNKRLSIENLLIKLFHKRELLCREL